MKQMIMKVIEETETMLRSRGFDVCYIGLYGSQNYNMHDEQSDIDLRAVVLPSLDDLVAGRSVSTKITTNAGDVDVKDIKTYMEVVKKGNFSFIEPFQTPYYKGDERLRTLFGGIEVNLQALKGAIHQKRKLFSKNRDPKNMSHALRLETLLYMANLSHLPISASYIRYPDNSPERAFLMDIKRGKGIYESLKKHFADSEFAGHYNWLPADYSYKETMENNYKHYLKPLVHHMIKDRILARWEGGVTDGTQSDNKARTAD